MEANRNLVQTVFAVLTGCLVIASLAAIFGKGVGLDIGVDEINANGISDETALRLPFVLLIILIFGFLILGTGKSIFDWCFQLCYRNLESILEIETQVQQANSPILSERYKSNRLMGDIASTFNVMSVFIAASLLLGMNSGQPNGLICNASQQKICEPVISSGDVMTLFAMVLFSTLAMALSAKNVATIASHIK